MPSQSGSDVKLEIGHVLFIDIVGYSKLLIDDQREVLQQLNQIARNTESFRAAEATNNLVRLPTGDGMALVFFTTPEAPMQCALEISEALQGNSQLKVRIGINTAAGKRTCTTLANLKSNMVSGFRSLISTTTNLGIHKFPGN